jgi:hypothetical protein
MEHAHQFADPVGGAIGELQFEHILGAEHGHWIVHRRGHAVIETGLGAYVAVDGDADGVVIATGPCLAVVGDVRPRGSIDLIHQLAERRVPVYFGWLHKARVASQRIKQ